MSTEMYFRLQSKDLALFKFILEGYEGLATVTTIDRHAGVIKLSTAVAFKAELAAIITAVQKEFSFTGFEPLTPRDKGVKEANEKK